ncbi:hypothetical protein Lepto7375DRAFT_7754 [Leptolyngbya sp. PCC 7375]|nr:hypothetical protein Lepto7375DRAFT_7754 [Leptolyngbya sp. PCC 7375]
MSTFTSTDKETIRRYMGYPVDQASIQRIQTRCATVESISPQAVATAQTLLRALERLGKQLAQATPFASQTFSSNAGGTNQYLPGQRLEPLKAEVRRQVQELSTLLQLNIYRDIYAVPTANAQVRRA